MMKFVFALLALTSAISAEFVYKPEPNQKVCRALSLSGGGSKGAFEVGAIYQLTRQLNGTDMQYDVYSGISVGSLTSAVLSLFEKGDELAQTEYLKQFWENITSSSDIYQDWPGFEAYEALFKKPSIYDTLPLRNLLDKTFKEHDYKIKRNYLIGATDLESGKEMVFDFSELNEDEYTNGTIASA